ncbi:MAG: ROK family protein [Acidobacteriaceae bacterium]|nr:ROK family protein [Acidobacteriaceae bacterium]
MSTNGGQHTRPILCVDIGGTSTKIGLFEQSPPVEIIDSLPSSGPASSFMEALCTRIRAVLNTKSGHPVFGLAVAVAGFLDENRDRMIYNPNLPWLENYPLRAHLAREFETRVELEVDSNAAAQAEQRFGSGQDSKRFLCIAVGTGLGVGMIIGGEPLRFSYGCLGDAGHVVIQRDGPLCPCGGRGCAEIFVSAPVLAEQYRAARRLDAPTSLRDVILAARHGDQAAIEVLDTAGGWLGVASASLANIFFPDRIAFAGGLAEAGDFVMTGLRRTFETSASQFARDQVTLCRATLGANATITGAACAFISAEHAG